MNTPARWPGAWGAADGRPMRVLRAVVFAAAGLGLAESAHLLAGGARPGSAVLAAAGVGLVLLGFAVSRRERSGRLIAALVVSTQAALHAAFALLPARIGHAGSAQAQNWADLLFCQHGPRSVTAAQIDAARAGLVLPGDAAAHPPALLGLGAVSMVALHLVAAAVLAWWLRRGERAAWATLRRIVTRIVQTVEDAPLRVPVRLVPVVAGWVPVRRAGRSCTAGRAPPRAPRLVILTG